ncbi:MAG: transglycosylase domain-containing protein [Candidatus Saccharibacteria bacterium]|nr:transglycosylase domain-containing protein [Microbacteriaceae bacterium]
MTGTQSARGAALGWLGIVGFSVLAGVLVAALALPAVLVPSRASAAAISVFENLPDYITIGRLSQQNEIFATRGGKPVRIATVFDQDRQIVAWDSVSKLVKDALVAGEDQRFYTHGGVDLKSIVRAAAGNVADNAITSGSSTIDMQLVKNILVQRAVKIEDPAARAKAYKAAITDTLSRKLREIKLAVGLDKAYSKQDILLGYLNIVGFGGNTYGVEAAAQKYFSVSAKDVTLAQAASLIAIVQQPSLQNLGDPSMYAANKVRRDQILADMLTQGYVDEAEYRAALATPIADEVHLSAQHSGCLYAIDAKFACDYVTRLVPTLTALGADATEREANWARGGYQIYTSVDLDQQDVATAALRQKAPAATTRFALGASAVSVQPGTGRILVMSQNKAFDNSALGGGSSTTAVNFNTDRAYGGSSGFPTGSTYKIFTLTDWLQNGHGLREYVNGSVRTFQQSSFSASCSKPFVGTYRPQNSSRYEGGYMSVLRATEDSVNVAFMTMAQQLDLCDIRDDATAMGVHRADGNPLVVKPSSVLGVNEIAPLTMAGAIATIGAGGTFCTPVIVDRIIDPAGRTLVGQGHACSEAMSPKVANTVAYALGTVMTGGTGTNGNPRDGVPLVGKTGTTDTADQNWLIGTTTKVALAVWVGNISGHQDLRRVTVAGTNGYNTKFDIFRTTLASLYTNPEYRGGDFPAPDPGLLVGQGVPVPASTGNTLSVAAAALSSRGLRFVDGGTVVSGLPAGQIARSAPAAGSVVSKGSAVTLYTSDGSLAVTMPDEVGKQRSAAVDDLVHRGFSRGQIGFDWKASSSRRCRIVASSPRPGAATSVDSTVTLTILSGDPQSGTAPPAAACP